MSALKNSIRASINELSDKELQGTKGFVPSKVAVSSCGRECRISLHGNTTEKFFHQF